MDGEGWKVKDGSEGCRVIDVKDYLKILLQRKTIERRNDKNFEKRTRPHFSFKKKKQPQCF